jgi:hypothetical protein
MMRYIFMGLHRKVTDASPQGTALPDAGGRIDLFGDAPVAEQVANTDPAVVSHQRSSMS